MRIDLNTDVLWFGLGEGFGVGFVFVTAKAAQLAKDTLNHLQSDGMYIAADDMADGLFEAIDAVGLITAMIS